MHLFIIFVFRSHCSQARALSTLLRAHSLKTRALRASRGFGDGYGGRKCEEVLQGGGKMSPCEYLGVSHLNCTISSKHVRALGLSILEQEGFSRRSQQAHRLIAAARDGVGLLRQD